MLPACLRSLPSPLFRLSATRSIATTSLCMLKEVQEKKDGNKIYVSGVHVESDRKGRVAAAPAEARADACPLCKLGLKNISYTDVLILSQFLTPGGSLMPKEDTKLCGSQYFKITKLVEMAQKCRLLPRPADYQAYGPWDRLKTYHDWPPRRRDVALRAVQPYYWKNVEHNQY